MFYRNNWWAEPAENISDKELQKVLDLYVKFYNEGPFKGKLYIEFCSLLNEKLRRNGF